MSAFSIKIYGFLLFLFGVDIASGQDYTLPSESKTPVIVLAYEGGFTPQRISNEPEMQVLADGSVILGSPYGQVKRVIGSINGERLQQILRYLLSKQRIGGFNVSKIQELVSAEQVKQEQFVTISDAATTTIQVYVEGNSYEAKFYGLSEMAEEYSEVEELNQLEDIRRYLESFRSEVYAGGKQKVTQYLEMANERLKQQYPEVSPLTLDDFQRAWQFNDDRIYVSFFREDIIDTDQIRNIAVSISIPSEKGLQIDISVNKRANN